MKLATRALAALTLVCSLAAQAEESASVNGKFIEVTGGEARSNYPVVSVPWEGAAAEDERYFVVQDGTGRDFPATLHEGKLTFLPRILMPGETYRFQVNAEKKDAAYAPVVRVQKREGEDVVEVFVEDELVTAYHYSNENKKPFLWPVNSMRGITVTRDFPMKGEVEQAPSSDHPHHKSMWVAYGDVNGADLWAEGGGTGFQRSDEVTFGSGDAYGWIRAKNTWLNGEQQPVLAEEREYRIYATPDRGRLIDQKVTLTAAHGDAKFGDTKEGGLCSVRMRPEMSGKNALITNAEGDTGEPRTWGKPSPWCDYSGEIEGAGVLGLTIMDHPSNFRHPSSWHVRAYGLMGANCFGYSHFLEKSYNEGLMPENGDHLLKAGEALAFNYRVYVHAGDVAAANVAERFTDYATPPKAVWLP